MVVSNAQYTFITQDVYEEYPESGGEKAYGWNYLFTGYWAIGSGTKIGLDAAATWYAAIVLDLSAHIGDSIVKIGHWHGDSATVTAMVYTGNYSNPLVLVGQSNPYTFTTQGWKQDIMLQNSILITSPGLYWIVMAIQDPGDTYFPMGARAPLNSNAGKISTDGTTWGDLSQYSLDFSWLLGAFVFSTCPSPMTLTATNIGPYTATLTWVDQGTISSWEIEYGESGFAQGTGTTVTSATTSVNISGLDHSTEYDFYVRGVCGPSEFSPWAGPGEFETQYVNDEADFLSYFFSFPGEYSIINYPTVDVTIPTGHDVTQLVANFTVSPGVIDVLVGGVSQISGSTPNNFSAPVIYEIHAEDSVTVKNWMVIVNGANSIIEQEEDGLVVFPNPSSLETYVYTPNDGLVSIYDMSGKLVLKKETSDKYIMLPENSLEKGVYLVVFKNLETQIQTKLLIY